MQNAYSIKEEFRRFLLFLFYLTNHPRKSNSMKSILNYEYDRVE